MRVGRLGSPERKSGMKNKRVPTGIKQGGTAGEQLSSLQHAVCCRDGSFYFLGGIFMKFQDMILSLNQFWGEQGCIIAQPYDMEKGAGTMNPATFLRALGPEPWNVAYVEPSRRPTDGRYGENPNRLQHYFQYQVILKPSPDNVQELYLESLERLGINPADHDIRFVEDNWESQPLVLGTWLGSLAGWHGSHPIYLFPAMRRNRL
jgi:hypothetical protein